MTTGQDAFRNAEAAQASGEKIDFSFGENWRKFLQDLTLEREAQAADSLSAAFGPAGLHGGTFLDLGCGSGLFSLAALRLGASRVVSIDVDPHSVACAIALRKRAGDPERWTIREGSLLDAGFVAQIEPSDRVYSWGVLHHTGAMWSAIENAMTLVRPGGLFCLALYNRPNHPAIHMFLKRAYNRAPRVARPAFTAAYGSAWLLMQAVRGRSPVRFVREYGATSRGMRFWRDVEDWLGGLPFEFTDQAGVRSFAESHGFVVESVTVRAPGNNNDYLLRRGV